MLCDRRAAAFRSHSTSKMLRPFRRFANLFKVDEPLIVFAALRGIAQAGYASAALQAR
jgi:hypothetical protein